MRYLHTWEDAENVRKNNYDILNPAKRPRSCGAFNLKLFNSTAFYVYACFSLDPVETGCVFGGEIARRMPPVQARIGSSRSPAIGILISVFTDNYH